jgi:transposase
MLQHHKAGERMFTDWAGLKMRILDSKTGELHEVSVFVAALGASQYVFAKAYESQELRCWLSGHTEAFEFYGALPEIVVPDNLKTGVDKACRYEPVVNPSYADLARFYELAVLPARVRKPRDKAKVENAVQQVERWVLAPLRNRTFFSVSEANEALTQKLAELNDKVMKGPNLSRKQFFEEVDQPAMRSLPNVRYVFASWKRAKVAPDYHVEVEGHLYSVPFTLVGKHVDARVSQNTVEVFLSGKRVASHMRSCSRRGFTTDSSHMPQKHRELAKWTPARMLRWAGTSGPNVEAFTRNLLGGKVHPEHGYRMCMGVMNLEKRFGKERLDNACARAVSLGAFSYKSVKSILEKNLESIPVEQSLLPLPSHDNIRGAEYYGGPSCANSL